MCVWGCVRGVCEYGKDWGGLDDVTIMIIVPLQVYYPYNNQPYFFAKGFISRTKNTNSVTIILFIRGGHPLILFC